MIAIAFLLGSALAAVAGWLWGAKYSTIDPFMGVLPEYKNKPMGSILGLLVGSALMVVLNNMINLAHPQYQNVEFAIIGGVILAGVIADELVRRATRRRPAA